ncbi:MAG: TetR family transcriptional regulator [Pseudonocardiaceae bacterium]|nr:TetR family transcriptional regulator [Pseudonocardiaceae bacterium]
MTRTTHAGDRKKQLGDVAANLFLEHGYHGVGVNDIAGAAGISGPALYRHFPSKQALLAHVLLSGLGHVHAAAETLDADLPAARRLSGFTRSLAEVAVEQRGASALWRWEGRHLTEDDHDGVLGSANTIMTRWSKTVLEARPELSGADADLLCWAAMSVFGSVAVHRTTLPKRRFVQLVGNLAEATLAVSMPAVMAADGPLPADTTPSHGTASHGVGSHGTGSNGSGSSKREELLGAATTLFRKHGFRAVSVEEIGHAAGLAAPSVYRHFASKADMLLAACRRMADRLAADAAALTDTDDPASTLDRLIVSYVDTAADNRDLIGVYSTDTHHLPPDECAELGRLQREYVARWVALAGQIRPDRDEKATRVTVHAALTIVNDLVRTGKTWQRARLRTELVTLARAVLNAEGA